MNTYSPLEASIKLNISKRAVQKRCKKDNVRKKDNKYEITDLILERWAKEIKSSVPVREPSNIGTQDKLKNVADIQELDLDEIEAFEFKFKRDADFYRIGKFVFVPNDKFIIQYSPAEYERLKKEYAQAENEIRTGRIKEETFMMLKKSMEEQIAFIKEQMQYYMKLASRTLDSQHLLIETLSNQTKTNFIESTIRAKNTEWKKGTEPNKKGK
jgi:hypothetical protein|tara:strand:+ start:88 stop:726 length:639 start_codon:yes stop_codon:yes gene_type:complete